LLQNYPPVRRKREKKEGDGGTVYPPPTLPFHFFSKFTESRWKGGECSNHTFSSSLSIRGGGKGKRRRREAALRSINLVHRPVVSQGGGRKKKGGEGGKKGYPATFLKLLAGRIDLRGKKRRIETPPCKSPSNSSLSNLVQRHLGGGERGKKEGEKRGGELRSEKRRKKGGRGKERGFIEDLPFFARKTSKPPG